MGRTAYHAQQRGSLTLMAETAKRRPIRERLAQVITMGRDKGRLTYDELNNLLPEDVASPEEIDELLILLGKEHIEIVDKPTGQSRLEDREEKESREEEAAELAQAGQLDDPVKMYLRQMGQISLLTREQELALAKRIEAAELAYRDAVLRLPIARREILRLTDLLIDGELNPEDYSKDDPNLKREELVEQLIKLRKRLKKARSKRRARPGRRARLECTSCRSTVSTAWRYRSACWMIHSMALIVRWYCTMNFRVRVLPHAFLSRRRRTTSCSTSSSRLRLGSSFE